jgi:2-methylcitrate dehydratase PrpD
LGCSAGDCTVIGTNVKVPARFAAFANGLAIHADDYDDTQLAVAKDRVYGLLTHPTAPALPPVLALAERERRSGADLMLAYQVGVEVECKVAEAISPRHYQHGFHSTATCGSIGAAAGAAKLLGLPRDAMRRALSLGATQAGGLRENFGTMTKPFHAGRAAENGVVAAEMAALGFTASPNGLEADRGFFRAAGGGYAPEMIEGKLGRPWTFAEPGISIKPHPSGSLTHPGMGAMLELVRTHDIQPAQVKRVTVGTNHNMPNTLIHRRPKNELQAKFSMEFSMAILLLERRAGLEQYTDEVVARPDVKAMIERVDFGVDPEADAAGFDKMTTLITVELHDGRMLSTRADFGKGSPANPMTDAELSEKFRECASWGKVEKARAEEILALLWKVETLADVGALTRLLRGASNGGHG